MERNVDKDLILGKILLVLQGDGKIIKLRDTVFINGLMVVDLKEIGKKITCMVKEFIHGQTGDYMRESI